MTLSVEKVLQLTKLKDRVFQSEWKARISLALTTGDINSAIKVFDEVAGDEYNWILKEKKAMAIHDQFSKRDITWVSGSDCASALIKVLLKIQEERHAANT